MGAKGKTGPTARQRLGSAGERMALARLNELGYRVIAKNWRCSIGELDLVAWHEQCLTFIEVRTRRGQVAGTPEQSITPTKKRRLLQLVAAFLQSEPGLLTENGEMPPCRIDVVAIEFGVNGQLIRLDVIQNAVQAE